MEPPRVTRAANGSSLRVRSGPTGFVELFDRQRRGQRATTSSPAAPAGNGSRSRAPMPSGLRWTTTARLDHPVEVLPRSARSIQITSFTGSSAAPVAMNVPSSVQLRAERCRECRPGFEPRCRSGARVARGIAFPSLPCLVVDFGPIGMPRSHEIRAFFRRARDFRTTGKCGAKSADSNRRNLSKRRLPNYPAIGPHDRQPYAEVAASNSS